MSQAGIIDFIGTHPQIPTMFVANVGTAIPIANTIELLGAAVAAHGVPLQTVASGNTVDFNIQYASAAASSIAGNAGVASFNSAFFTVDANGFVSISGGSLLESFTVDASTPPGTNPVVPNGSGVITVTGGQVAAGTTTNVIRTDSLAANTYTIEIQRSQAVATSTIGDNGVSHFSSNQFAVDANGFVTLLGGGQAIDSIAVQTGTSPIIPTVAGLVTINGAVVAAGTNPVRTDGTGVNTMAVEVQITQAIAATDATKIGLANFDSAAFDVDANGFVQLNGGGIAATAFTVQANTAPGTNPVVPTAAGVVTVNGAAVANHSVVLETRSRAVNAYNVEIQYSAAAAATDATKSGVAHFNSTYFTVDANGFVSLSGTTVGQTITGNSGGALSPTAGNWNILGTGSLTSVGSGSTLTMQLTGLTNHAVQVGAGTATLTQVGPSATTGAVLASNGVGSDPSFQTIASLGGITTITGNSGGAESPSSGNFNILGTGSITVAGSANTETVQLTGLTNHNVLIGAGTATITNVAPSATSGVPLISNGASSDPSFGTAVVAGGGTGDTSFIAYTPICGGTTTTGALQSVASIGTTGQVLTSNGAGALPTFQTISATGAFDQIAVQVFTASGTYTPNANMKYCTIEVVGGGGGGGGCAASAWGSGGGGGGGGYGRKTVTKATIGSSQTVTIGAGGTAGANTGGTGGTGGTSSLGSIVTASGGLGGEGSATGNTGGQANTCVGGIGGLGGSGDFNCYGGTGFMGVVINTTISNMLSTGAGGSSIFGGGGVGHHSNANGNTGNVYGGGGGGAGSFNNASSFTGGVGAAGIVVVTEFLSV